MDLITTENLSGDITWDHVIPEAITARERRLIMEQSLGYCETHCILYRRVPEDFHGGFPGMPYCLVRIMNLPNASECGPCKEWGETC